MSTSGPSHIKENTHEIALLKEQMVEMIRLMQQLVVEGVEIRLVPLQRAL